MKLKLGDRCGICFFGKPEGEYEGVPICKECLSHRVKNVDKILDAHNVIDIADIELTKESEWIWWQKKARELAFEFFGNL